jgi:hypothetical protein
MPEPEFGLIKKKTVYSPLRFPLVDQDQYDGRILFQVIETQPIASVGTAANSQLATEITGLGQNAALAAGAALGFGKTIVDKKKIITPARTHEIPGAFCSLYMPGNLTFQDGVQYDEIPLGVIGASVESIINSGTPAAAAVERGVMAAMGESVNSISDFFKAGANDAGARYAALRIAKHLGGEQVYGGVSSALQTSINPNKRLLFKEVNLRDFNFSFKLIPSSKEEATEISNIVKFFRTELYPEDNVELTNGIIAGHRFPNKFRITFKHRKRDVAYKILDSHLVNISSAYNTTGAGFFEDGNFTELDVTLFFREATTLSKAKIQEGY